MVRSVGLLATHPFMQDVPRSAVQQLSPHVRLVSVQAGQRIVRRPGRADLIWLMCFGQLTIGRATEDGRTIMVDTIYAGEVLHTAWLDRPQGARFTVVAASHAFMIEFEARALRPLAADDPLLAERLNGRLDDALRRRLELAESRMHRQRQ
jgi:CRP-like cAMP-binding protein